MKTTHKLKLDQLTVKSFKTSQGKNIKGGTFTSDDTPNTGGGIGSGNCTITDPIIVLPDPIVNGPIIYTLNNCIFTL